MLKRTRVSFTGEFAAGTQKVVFVCLLGVLCVGFGVVVDAAPPVKNMYNGAVAREQAVRTALTAPDASPSVLNQVRAVIAAYEAVVRRYPASGYSDNAL